MDDFQEAQKLYNCIRKYLTLKPNVLFLVLDSLRADSCYENAKLDKVPHIAQLIKKGVNFDKAFSCTDYTTTSIQAIFTARYPFGCGITKDHYYKIFSKSTNFVDTLKANGYHAYAILEDSLCSQGVDKPFENSDVEFASSKNLYNGLESKFLEKFENDNIQQPWFFYIHLMDLHKPCVVPQEYNHLKQSERYDLNLTKIDSSIGKILKKIDMSNTLFIITADHGEYISPFDDSIKEVGKTKSFLKKVIKSVIFPSLRPAVHVKKQQFLNDLQASKTKTAHEKRAFQKRPAEDRYMYDDVIRVPLIFSGYGINEHSTITTQVRNIDIFPTILEILDLSLPNKKIHGKSFMPLIEGKKTQTDPLYMESTIIKTIQKNPQAVIGIRTKNYKYFRHINDPKKNAHLYNLEKDPYEEDNILKNNSKIIEEFEEIMHKIRETAIAEPEPEKLTDEEEKELEAELKKMGYI